MDQLGPDRSITRAIKGSVLIKILLLVTGIGATSAAMARELQCGAFEFPECKAQDDQFEPAFKKKLRGIGKFGGFGGGQCAARKIPVIFIHGNADYATDWDSPITGAIAGFPAVKNSVYHELKAQGYNDCELFGISFLKKEERNAPQSNYHQLKKYQITIGQSVVVRKSYANAPGTLARTSSTCVRVSMPSHCRRARLTHSCRCPDGVWGLPWEEEGKP